MEPSDRQAEPARHNLPAFLSSFIGRRQELAEVRQLLRTERLLTLTGAGGSGKTRMAVQLAAEAQPSFEDGVWMVDLAPLADGKLVPQAVASVLDVSEQRGRALTETLTEHLQSRCILLLLDNCEHLVQACAQLAQTLLQACPELTILATSREPLGIAGETVWTVPPLALPRMEPWTGPAAAQAVLRRQAESEAVQLFVARATAHASDFELGADNTAWVAKICRDLDGMPLAIELAAARVRSLSVHQISQRLDDSLSLLTVGSRTAPPRQQTLAATMDWSYALLSPDEQHVLQRLSVFAGGATLPAAARVCAPGALREAEVLDLLTRLVDKSLVTVDRTEPGETRYRLLETIRQYAWQKLDQAGAADEARDRHLAYLAAWAAESEPHIDGPDRAEWLERYEREHDNLRAALEWSLLSPERAEQGLRLASVAGLFWARHGHHGEGRRRLTAALAQDGAQSPTPVRARALLLATLLAFYQSDYASTLLLAQESLAVSRALGPAGRISAAEALEMLAEVGAETGAYSKAEALYTESLGLAKEAGYDKGIAENLKMLGWLAMRSGDLEKAGSLLEQALAVCRTLGDPHQVASALSGLGELAIRQGRYERAQALLEESMALTIHLGDRWEHPIALGSLAWIAFLRGDFEQMRALLGQSLEMRLETGDRGGTAWCLEKLGAANVLQAQPKRAAMIFAAADALRLAAQAAMDEVDRPEHERTLADLRTAMGEEAFDAAWKDGAAMPLRVAVLFALEPQETAATAFEAAQPGGGAFDGLTKREREVAALIGQGKSNREIAEAMTVGAKTVETYVTRILAKLGLESRVQIALRAVESKSRQEQTR